MDGYIKELDIQELDVDSRVGPDTKYLADFKCWISGQ